MISARGNTAFAGLIGLSALAACDVPPSISSVPPEQRPAQPVTEAPPPDPEVVSPSPASEALSLYYRRLQNEKLTQGLLRGDSGSADTPFTSAQLARNFVRIALFDEYASDGDILRPRATLSRLRRWDEPVRMDVEFGASVPEAQRTIDRNTVATYAARLSRITGLPITITDRDPNFHVLVLNEGDRQDYGDRLRQLVPGISASTLRTIANLSRETQCLVIAFTEDNRYAKSIAIVRGEHPDLLRTSCFHEELAQGLGLVNDSPQAKPSIFNDDDEFARLTRHDELLLRMLYDDRFKTGMSAAEAAPIARMIARELLDAGPT